MDRATWGQKAPRDAGDASAGDVRYSCCPAVLCLAVVLVLLGTFSPEDSCAGGVCGVQRRSCVAGVRNLLGDDGCTQIEDRGPRRACRRDGRRTLRTLLRTCRETFRECRRARRGAGQIYDATVRTEAPFSGRTEHPGVARVVVDGADRISLTILFDGFEVVTARGSLRGDGTMSLRGERIYGGDALVQVAVRARRRATAQGVRIVGSVRQAGEPSLRFTMTRGQGGAPAYLDGVYHLAFPGSPGDCGCATSAEIELSVSRKGIARTRAAVEVDEIGNPRGVLEAGECLISPAGFLRCQLPYAVGGFQTAVVLEGRLQRQNGRVEGGGRFVTGLPPVLLSSGSWSASK